MPYSENLKKFIDEGKIRNIGLSNETPWGFSKFLQIANEKKLPKVVSVQNPYNLVNRSYEVGMSEISMRENAGLLAYSPLGIGYLTGKYRNKQIPKNSRLDLFYENYPRYHNERTYDAVEKYYEIAKKHNIPFSKLALAFVNSRDFVTSNIIGATKMDQLKENIESIDVTLNENIISDINLVHVGKSYEYLMSNISPKSYENEYLAVTKLDVCDLSIQEIAAFVELDQKCMFFSGVPSPDEGLYFAKVGQTVDHIVQDMSKRMD